MTLRKPQTILIYSKMATTEFTIRQANVLPHLDIERDIKATKTGIFTFTLRANGGSIVDYVNYKNVKPGEHDELIQAVVSQLSPPRSH